MEVKHKECFIPNTISYFGLQASAATPARRPSSSTCTRRPGHQPLSGPDRDARLAARAAGSHQAGRADSQLQSVAGLDEAGDQARQPGAQSRGRADRRSRSEADLGLVEGRQRRRRRDGLGVPPFPFVRETLEKLVGVADVIVFSATPGKALAEGMGRARDRRLHAGHLRPGSRQQEGNPRARHQGGLLAAKCGDDRRRAGRHGGRPRRRRAVLPRQPGERRSELGAVFRAACDRFLAGNFAGPYEADLVAEFDTLFARNAAVEEILTIVRSNDHLRAAGFIPAGSTRRLVESHKSES